VVFDTASERPLDVRLDFVLEAGSGPSQKSRRFKARFKETESVPLSAAHRTSLPEEVMKFHAIGSALEKTMQGDRPGGLLGALGIRRRQTPPDPLALLKAYSEEFPDGALADAVAPSRATVDWSLERVRQQQAAQQRGAEIVGMQAPDFTLKDLSGKDVSLSQYHGKVILLAFWGVG